MGATYTHVDQGLTVGQTYSYKLEAVDIYGASQFEGPVSIAVEALCGAIVRGTSGWMLVVLALLFLPALIVFSVKRRLSR